MKYYEFKEKIKELDDELQIIKEDEMAYIVHQNENIASVGLDRSHCLNSAYVCTRAYIHCDKLVELVYNLAITPVSERYNKGFTVDRKRFITDYHKNNIDVVKEEVLENHGSAKVRRVVFKGECKNCLVQ